MRRPFRQPNWPASPRAAARVVKAFAAAAFMTVAIKAVAQSVGPSSAPQDPSQPQMSADRKFWELSVYYPFQYYLTDNDLGRSSAYTAAGVGLSAHRPLGLGLGVLAFYQADLNAVSGATIFTGASLGVTYTVFGQDEMRSRSPTLVLRRRPRVRGLMSFGVGQRSYDFRSLITEEAVNNARAQGKTIDVEGSGWAPFARVQVDAVVGQSARVGTFAQVQSILPSSISSTTIQSLVLGLVYDFGRLSSEEGAL